jgi:cellobiose phosphorylase
MARYGYFDDARREYVITRPELPQPWFNYIRNDEYTGLVSHTGGGTSFWKDPLRLRLLRYKFHLTPYDRPGRYVYIRDRHSGRYWSATWAPVQTPLARTRFECRVGLGYNRITTRYDGIEAEMLYFVPPDDALEIWQLTLTNRSRRRRRLRTFSYAEWAVWGVLRDLLNIDNAAACARYCYDGGVFWHTTPNDVGSTIGTSRWVFSVGYFTSDAEPAGFDGSRDHFLGPCRDESRPVVVERGLPSNLCANGLYPLGGLAHDWDLRPGQSRRITYQLGAGTSKRPLARRIKKYRKPEVVEAAFQKLARIWARRLSTFQARTPDERFDTVVNIWNPYQVINVTSTGTGVSPVSWGTGSNMGFRDNGQSVLSAAALDPPLARRTVQILSHVQHRDGTLTKNFAPPVWGGESGFLDNQAWYPIFVNAYLKETGDFELLKEKFPFVQGGRRGLLAKMVLAMQVLWDRRGPHGLPATGHADWNDCLNPVPRVSESVFNAMLFCAGCTALAEIFAELKRLRQAALWAGRRTRMAAAIERHAWDGAWYLRMFLAGTPRVLGSRRSRKWGRIFLEPQAWAALCGALRPGRARRAMDSARKILASRFGLRIVAPPCPQYEPRIGSIGILNMGFKENGSVYSHTNAWSACAEAVLGRGELAFKTFMDYQPIMRNDEAEVREIEPYVLSAQVQAEPFIQPGRGRNPWVTGSATWTWLAATQYILGVRAEFSGLRIDPCIPATWRGFTATRRFRGAFYHIEVRNPHRLCRGVKRLRVNGRDLPGCIAPLPRRPGQETRVETVLED